MIDPLLIDLLFTIAACVALLGLFVTTLALLPWSRAELDEAEAAFRDLGRLPFVAPPRLQRVRR